MAKKRGDGDQQEPTLELPSLRGRGKRRRQAATEVQPVAPPVAMQPEPEPRRKAEPKAPRRTGPLLPAPVAALVTGLLVGLVGTALTYASLRGCEEIRGTDSCGGAGLGVLVGIVIVMVLGGALVLKLLGVSEPRGTSFLAIGLMCVIVLVTLMQDVFSVWMFLAIPLICAASYAAGHWVTTRFVEDVDERPHVDVR